MLQNTKSRPVQPTKAQIKDLTPRVRLNLALGISFLCGAILKENVVIN
jgi:hypothetical protein